MELIQPDYNKNLLHLIKTYDDDGRGAILEGSSRSGKTFSSIDFVIGLCTVPGVHNLVIYLVKETYNSFKTTLYNDFNVRLPMHGLPSPMATVKDVPMFDIYGNRIYFIGADQASKFEGAGCDFFWINEMLDVSKAIFDQLEMRCRVMWWGDFNPKVSNHWVFDLEKRDREVERDTMMTEFEDALERDLAVDGERTLDSMFERVEITPEVREMVQTYLDEAL